MIINTSYFFGDLYIAQITETQVANTVNKYIQKYEPQFLQRVFGYEMAKNIDTTYPDILNGKEFNNVYNANRLDKWIGLKVDLGGGKFSSVIANYVYTKYMEDNMSFSTGSGEKIIEQTSSETVSPGVKIIRAWNEMVDQLNVLVQFMMSDRVTYVAYSPSYSDRSFFRKTNAFGI